MPVSDAVILDNFDCEVDRIATRSGYSQHATSAPSAVETLMAYQGPVQQRLWAVANNSFYNVTGAGTWPAATVTGLTNNRWQYANFGTSGGNFIVAVNGADTPRQYDGTTWSSSTMTGSGLTVSKLVHVFVHQRRLFFIEDDTLNFWYLDVDAVTGTLAKFNLAPLCQLGGELVAGGSWTVDGGAGLDDVAVFVTSQGEAIVYRGTDPSDSDFWALVGVFRLGRPIGRRCLIKLAGDLIIITEDGFFPVSRALANSRAKVSTAISDKIRGAVWDAAKSYGTNFGWEAVHYPRGNKVLFNIPVVANDTTHQYVMNTTTSAWSRYTGLGIANCFALLNERLYFGGNTYVGKADDGTSDNGALINTKCLPAFNHFGSPGRKKRFTQMLPLMENISTVNMAVKVNVDFKVSEPTVATSVVGTANPLWDVNPWDVTPWGGTEAVTNGLWQGGGDIGFYGAMYLKTRTSNAQAALIAINYQYEEGGMM